MERELLTLTGSVVGGLRYGQNAHQTPARQISWGGDYRFALDKFTLDIRSEVPSATNLLDMDAGIRAVLRIAAAIDRNPLQFPRDTRWYTAVGIKHASPCSAVIAKDPVEAARRLILANPLSIMGGFIVLDFHVSLAVAVALRRTGVDTKRGLDGVVAPSFDFDAIEYLDRTDGRCKIFSNEGFTGLTAGDLPSGVRYLPVLGGAIEEPYPLFVPHIENPAFEITGKLPDSEDWAGLFFAYCVCAQAKSNTIVIAQYDGDGCYSTVGIGAGQTDRVSAAELAVKNMRRDGHDGNTKKFGASDSFYPFADGLIALTGAGINMNFATSGSRNDGLVASAALTADTTLVRLPDKMARGFEH